MSEGLPLAPDKVLQVFESNAGTYDRVNTVISLGLDARWRDWVARQAVLRPGSQVLDAFAGTGLVGIRAAELGGIVTLADASPRMLARAARTAARRHVEVTPVVVDLAAAQLPALPGAPFDAVTMVFGVRYLEDPSAVIARLSQTLTPAGRFVVMDFVEPQPSIVSRVAAWYFFRVLPRIAAALSGHPELYRLLSQTTHHMGGRDHLRRIVEASGLRVQQVKTMGFGLVVAIVASRAG